MTVDLYHKIDSLLAQLRAFGAVQLVRQHFRREGNDAPGELLQQDIDALQVALDREEVKP